MGYKSIEQRSEIKIPLNPIEMESVKSWIKKMESEDPNFTDVPKPDFGKDFVKLDIFAAITLMPWIDTHSSGDLDAYRFKTNVLKALRTLEAKEDSPWWRSGITKAINLIQETPVGEYMHEGPPRIATS